jgi:hypothetical protein
MEKIREYLDWLYMSLKIGAAWLCITCFVVGAFTVWNHTMKWLNPDRVITFEQAQFEMGWPQTIQTTKQKKR